jgi:epoxyqueuosine reductase QueG
MDKTAFNLVWFLKKKGHSALTRYMEENYAPIHLQINKADDKIEFNQRFPHVELASKAGLGTRGKMKWLVTPEYGPRLCLMSVLTDAIVSYDTPQDFNPCKDCNACVDACPYLQNHKSNVPISECWLCNARICIHICPVGKKMGINKKRGE